jgi:hypothetical protein
VNQIYEAKSCPGRQKEVVLIPFPISAGPTATGKHSSATPCVELKDIVKRSASKVDSIFAILAEEHTAKGDSY